MLLLLKPVVTRLLAFSRQLHWTGMNGSKQAAIVLRPEVVVAAEQELQDLTRQFGGEVTDSSAC